MTNGEIAGILSDIATMLEMEGANPFRIRAYREGARLVGAMAEPVMALEPGKLEGTRGIGKDLAQKIRDLAATGTTAIFEELRLKIPAEVVALTELPGMGPKKAKALFDRLGIRSRADLETAARAGKLRALAGFGETTEKNVLKALEVSSQWAGRVPLAGAWSIAESLLEHVRKTPGVEIAEIAGSFRRRKETIGDLDLLVCGGDAATVMSAFTAAPEVAEVTGRGDTKSSVRLRNGLAVDLRLVPPESFGAAMLYFTGSKEHNIELRKVALAKGMNLNEYALTRGETRVAGRTEAEVYAALGMDWIPPELREACGEIGLAIRRELPALIEPGDLVGDLHLHTDRTDGRESLETMVRAARDRGYAYCAITDHSKALAMSRGFDEARVRRSVTEIEAVRKAVPGIHVLHGLEVDILADGALDLDDETLALLDWVIVSLHSRLDQSGDVMTARVLRALSHPLVHAMGHPTARMFGSRPPAALDLEQVIARAAERGVALEINAQPHRMDLSDTNARRARARGVPLVIDTDAHTLPEMDHMRYGVFVARRAGLTKGDVLNTLPFERFRERTRRGVMAAAGPVAVTAAPAKAAKAAAPRRSGKPKAAAPARPAKRGAPRSR